MNNAHKSEVFMTATGGIVTALGVAVCLAGGFTGFTKLLFPAVCGLMLVIVRYYVSATVAGLSFVATSLLLLLFSPDKFTALAYSCLLGYYPMLFNVLSRVKPLALRLIIKAVFFVSVVAAALIAAIKISGVADNGLFKGYGWVLAASSVLFLAFYDVFIGAFYNEMQTKWDGKLKKLFNSFR